MKCKENYFIQERLNFYDQHIVGILKVCHAFQMIFTYGRLYFVYCFVDMIWVLDFGE